MSYASPEKKTFYFYAIFAEHEQKKQWVEGRKG